MSVELGPSEAARDNVLLSGDLLAIAGVSRLPAASLGLCLHLLMVLPCVCGSVCVGLPAFIFPLLIMTPVLTGEAHCDMHVLR